MELGDLVQLDMYNVELSPSLSHCIETVANEEYWRSVNQYMESEQKDRMLEQKIELLKAFLELMDFKKLRRESERCLVEGKMVKFTIYWKRDKPHYEMTIS